MDIKPPVFFWKGLSPVLIFIFVLFESNSVSSQVRYTGEFSVQGMGSTTKELPFWMYSNQHGRISQRTNLLSVLSGRAAYVFRKSSFLKAGVGVYWEDEGAKLNFDALFLEYQNKWLEITLGRKKHKDLYGGLSSSNESILWSQNSRPLPGMSFKLKEPIFILSNRLLGVQFSLGEYFLDDERHVKNTQVHYKSFHLVSQLSSDWIVKIGARHYVQWRGESVLPGHGKQPSSFKDYLRVVTGTSGDSKAAGGDQLNSLGNHLGGYEIAIRKVFPNASLDLFYNHLFDDKSGMRLGNTPDGRYGLFLSFEKDNRLINNFLYEFYYTKHQSSTSTGAHPWDNYFNNYLYRSGWTYEENTIGSPLFTPNFFSEDYSSGYVRIGNNIFVAHHLGLSGFFNRTPYKLLMTYRSNYGHNRIVGDYVFEHYSPDDPRGKFYLPKNIFSIFLSLEIIPNPIRLEVRFSGDNWEGEINFGGGIILSKNLF